MNAHSNVYEHFKMNHELMYWHKYSLTELNEMIPWERDVYVQLILNELEKKKKKNEH